MPAAASSGRAPSRSCTSSCGESRGHMRFSASITSGVRRSRWISSSRSSASSVAASTSSAPESVSATPVEPAAVLVGQHAQHLRLDEAPPRVVRSGTAPGRGHDLLRRRGAQPQHAGSEGDGDVTAQGPLPGAHGAGQDLDHARVALERGHRGVVHAAHAHLGDEARHGREAHAGLAERGQHLLDVAQEQRVRPDDEDALALEREAVRVEQVGGAVQRHRGLARPGAALHHEDAGQGRADDLVLLPLDRRHDVAHVPGPRLAQGREERARAAEDEAVAEQSFASCTGRGREPARRTPLPLFSTTSTTSDRRPRLAPGIPKYSSSRPTTVRPRTARWRRRASPCGSSPVAR